MTGYKHGHCRGSGATPEWRAWRSMRLRCQQFKRYSGVKICDRWNSFEAFLEDMGLKPTPQHSLDRIDNAKGYGPDNCRWATWSEQNQNRSNTRWLTVQGETACLSEWAQRAEISVQLLWHRLRQGWGPEEALGVRPGGLRWL